jgi:hypothetical protein
MKANTDVRERGLEADKQQFQLLVWQGTEGNEKANRF